MSQMPVNDHAEEVADVLHRAGISEVTIEAVVHVDALMQRWRRRMHKRELGHRALAALGVPLDLAQFDVLAAIEAQSAEFGDAPSEVTVGMVAERLAIDPSRASRMVTEMVGVGYARREASQADSRRTVLALTPAGDAVIEAVRAYKWLLLGDFMSGWQADELTRFVAQLEHFSEWSGMSTATEQKFGPQVAALADKVSRRAPSFGRPDAVAG